MSRTAVIEGQDALFAPPAGDEPAAAPKPAKRRKRTPPPRRRMNHVLPLGYPWQPPDECNPTCARCGKPEGIGLCHTRCAVVCGKPRPLELDPHGRAPVEVCLITTHVTARLIAGLPGAEPGRKLAAVDCPRCHRVHWHGAAYGARYRIAPCNWQPYIVHLPRPAAVPTAVEHTEEHQHATARGAAAARAALAERTTNA
jgi:hypothetical protein